MPPNPSGVIGPTMSSDEGLARHDSALKWVEIVVIDDRTIGHPGDSCVGGRAQILTGTINA